MLAPSWSPLFVPQSRSLPALAPIPAVLYESPIMTSHEWWVDRQAEEGAQLETKKTVLVASAHCEICDIHIGPDHVEQELFVYPAYGDRDVQCIIHGREHLLTKEDLRAIGGYWFFCCGGCARARKRQLPESYCIFDARHWTTTLLIQQEGEPIRPAKEQDFEAIWLAKDTYSTMKIDWFLLLGLVPHLVALGISLRAYFALVRDSFYPKEPEPVTVQEDMFIAPTPRSGFTMRPSIPMLAS